MRIDELAPAQKANIDLHGLSVEQGEIQLIELLNALPKTVRAVEVTHGYSRGTALKNMVKNQFYHWRVLGKQVGLNPGVTWLILK